MTWISRFLVPDIYRRRPMCESSIISTEGIINEKHLIYELRGIWSHLVRHLWVRHVANIMYVSPTYLHWGIWRIWSRPASYPIGTRGSFLGVNRPGCEADHSPSYSAEVKEWVELYLHSTNTPSWRGAQLKTQGWWW